MQFFWNLKSKHVTCAVDVLLELVCVQRNKPDKNEFSYLVVSSSDEAARLEPVMSPSDCSTPPAPPNKGCCL